MQIRHILLYGIIGISFLLLFVGWWYRSQPDVEIGRRLVVNSCGVCHDLTAAQNHERGPYLWGVYNRHAGSSGFNHSEAFLNKISGSDFIWDDKNLNAFISNPSKFIPRTEMGKHDSKHPTAFSGIESASNREDVIAFLKTLR
ncbi:MAG: c-type cytochrome [Magnetococcales bacterium]|nr:c-type cytochrome [Magnetococcales bacterium]